MPNSTRLGEVYLLPHKTVYFNWRKAFALATKLKPDMCYGKNNKSPWHKYIMNTLNAA